MQSVVRSVAVFCTACLCAELLTLFVPNGSEAGARRCIKAVAGLYILVVFFRLLPLAGASWQSMVPPRAAPMEWGTQEEILRAETERELAQTLAAMLAGQTGKSAEISVSLEADGIQLSAASVTAVLPAGSTEKERQQAAAFLQRTLDLLPEEVRVTVEQEAGS